MQEQNEKIHIWKGLGYIEHHWLNVPEEELSRYLEFLIYQRGFVLPQFVIIAPICNNGCPDL